MEILILSEKANPQITTQHLKKLQDYTAYFCSHFERIHVLSSFDFDQIPQFAFPPEVIFHRMPPWRPAIGYKRGLLHLVYIFRLFWEGRKLMIHNPQIVTLTQNFSHYVLGLIVLLLAAIYRRTTIIRIAGDPEVGRVILKQRYGLVGIAIGAIFPYLERLVAMRADRIFSSSQLLLEKYPQLTFKTTILPDPVPILDDSCVGNKPIRKRERQKGEPVKAIFVGRLEPEKGLNVLLEALASTPNYHCQVIGSGSLAPKLKALVNELGLSGRLSMCGQKPNNEVVELIMCADVLILPSYTEYTPAVILEAAAVETPVIAAKAGGVKFIVKDKVTGLMFEPGDVKALRSAMAYFQDSSDLWSEWGRNAKKFACDNFSSNILFKKSDSALRTLKREIHARDK